jgi:hypothetical protein
MNSDLIKVFTKYDLKADTIQRSGSTGPDSGFMDDLDTAIRVLNQRLAGETYNPTTARARLMQQFSNYLAASASASLSTRKQAAVDLAAILEYTFRNST